MISTRLADAWKALRGDLRSTHITALKGLYEELKIGYLDMKDKYEYQLARANKAAELYNEAMIGAKLKSDEIEKRILREMEKNASKIAARGENP